MLFINKLTSHQLQEQDPVSVPSSTFISNLSHIPFYGVHCVSCPSLLIIPTVTSNTPYIFPARNVPQYDFFNNRIPEKEECWYSVFKPCPRSHPSSVAFSLIHSPALPPLTQADLELVPKTQYTPPGQHALLGLLFSTVSPVFNAILTTKLTCNSHERGHSPFRSVRLVTIILSLSFLFCITYRFPSRFSGSSPLFVSKIHYPSHLSAGTIN
jgi:hypothetical protein